MNHLSSSEEEFELVFDALPVVAFVLDRKTKHFIAVNQAALDMYGFTKEEMLSMGVSDVRPPADAPFFVCTIPRALTGGRRINIWRHRTKSGELLDLELAIAQIDWQGTPALLVTANDATARRKAEQQLNDTKQKLEESERELQLFASATNDVLWRWHIETDRVIRTSRIQKFLGYTYDNVQPTFQWWAERIHPEDCQKSAGCLLNAIEDGKETCFYEYRFRRRDGSYATLSDRAIFVRNREGQVESVVGATTDISERVQHEESILSYSKRMEELAQMVIRAQENERRRIARELHDQVGQNLTLLRLTLQTVREWDPDIYLATRISECTRLSDRILADLQNLAFELRPYELDDLGLAAATRAYLDRVGRLDGPEIKFEAQLKSERLPVEIETACFRITQEAICNVLRHARARSVQVRVCESDDTLQLEIHDDGVGFAAESDHVGSSRHLLGVHGMKERAEVIGGALRIESTVGKGTSVIAVFPISGLNRCPTGPARC